jgi:signal transduction histidine kinase
VSSPSQAPQRRPRPPLTKRLRPGHWVALDVLAALMFAVALTVPLQRVIFQNGIATSPADLVLALVLATVMCLPVALRRRRPLLAFGSAIAAATLVSALVPAASIPYLYVPTAYLLYLVAVVSRRRVSLAALGILLAVIVTQALLREPLRQVAGDVAPALLLVIITWGFGYAVRQRRVYAEQLRDQAATSAVTEERLRIARELHDVVAHSMTVIAVQAGYGHHVIEDQPTQAREALGAIQATSREALADMRRMLGVLRQSGPEPFGPEIGAGPGRAVGPAGIVAPAALPAANGHGPAPGRRTASSGNAAPLAPAPGLADLDRLVARIARAGVRVDLQVRGLRRELPPGIDLAAFRIVQEALTNVVKHADTPSCRVIVGYGAGELSVEITDEGQGSQVPAAAAAAAAPGPRSPGPGGPGGEEGEEMTGGHGLIGMRERVSLYGGEFSAGPRPEQGFRVAARLPTGDAGS